MTSNQKNMNSFYQILVNTFVANITTSFLWFALTFWVYLETKSVLATGIIGGSYMLLVAFCSIWFGTLVDHHKKRTIMLFAAASTLVAFLLAGIFFMLVSKDTLLDISQPYFWVFTLIILAGAVVENMRNIALSTTVTLLVPKDKRANANGLVGSVQGIGFIITSVFSGLAVGFLGMKGVLIIACALTALAFVHILFVQIPEKGIAHDPELKKKQVDIKGSIAAIKASPGLFGLLFFSMLNNFIGGVYMALMDPYGLTMFSVQMWGIVFGVAGTGFVIGGLLVAKFGLGKNPVRTLLRVAVIMGILGAVFTLREWWWLYAAGIWVYMVLIPIIESAEQTVIQRIVPYKQQGRVFGFAQALESSAAPITAFAIAPIAQFWIIPMMAKPENQEKTSWLLGTGEARGIALIFLIAGILMVAVSLLAFASKTYRRLSETYKNS